MSGEKTKLSGPDLTQGVELSTVPDGTMLLGHARGEPVLLVRRGKRRRCAKGLSFGTTDEAKARNGHVGSLALARASVFHQWRKMHL